VCRSTRPVPAGIRTPPRWAESSMNCCRTAAES
jgi:hypothetical protein